MATDKKDKATSAKPDKATDSEKYKYHQSQIEKDKDDGREYPDKPKNHTTTEERLLDPDRGEK